MVISSSERDHESPQVSSVVIIAQCSSVGFLGSLLTEQAGEMERDQLVTSLHLNRVCQG